MVGFIHHWGVGGGGLCPPAFNPDHVRTCVPSLICGGVSCFPAVIKSSFSSIRGRAGTQRVKWRRRRYQFNDELTRRQPAINKIYAVRDPSYAHLDNVDGPPARLLPQHLPPVCSIVDALSCRVR